MGFRTGKRLSSPFSKGGPRGILLRGRPPEDHRYILTVQAKINPMTPKNAESMTPHSSLRHV